MSAARKRSGHPGVSPPRGYGGARADPPACRRAARRRPPRAHSRRARDPRPRRGRRPRRRPHRPAAQPAAAVVHAHGDGGEVGEPRADRGPRPGGRRARRRARRRRRARPEPRDRRRRCSRRRSPRRRSCSSGWGSQWLLHGYPADEPAPDLAAVRPQIAALTPQIADALVRTERLHCVRRARARLLREAKVIVTVQYATARVRRGLVDAILRVRSASRRAPCAGV